MFNTYINKVTGALIETPSVLYGGDWEKVETTIEPSEPTEGPETVDEENDPEAESTEIETESVEIETPKSTKIKKK